MEKRALLCKIKKIYYKPLEEEIYVGYIQSVISGEIIKKDEQINFEVNGAEYTLNLKKIISHTRNHEFIERVFTFISDDILEKLVGEFVIIEPQNQQLKTINDV